MKKNGRFPLFNYIGIVTVVMLLISISFSQTQSSIPAAQGELVELTSTTLCNRCLGYYLPGRLIPSPRAAYRIDSDLPEMYSGNGILYATIPVLPPMKTKSGQDIPEDMRCQINAGFNAVDDSFEVFLYHLSGNHSPGETRRIVIYARNIGAEHVELMPRQSMHHGPNAGKMGSVESLLGEDVLTEKWEHPVASVVLAPGEGGIIGYSRQLGSTRNTEDETTALFVTGILRAHFLPSTPPGARLELFVVSIPGNRPKSEWGRITEGLLDVGAQSGEGAMDLLIPPPQCHVRRVVGTARNWMWRGDLFQLDVNTLKPEGAPFLMALPKVQSGGCEMARQTADLLLHPPYVHSDSVGNFMMEYKLTFRLTNTGNVPRKFDVHFGKNDARIGLAWQAALGDKDIPLTDLEKLPVFIGWAGKGTPGLAPPFYSESMLSTLGGPCSLEPGSSRVLNLRLMVLGTSSLPYHLIIRPAP